jgi:hypothetical protein
MAIDPREIQLAPEQQRQIASLADESGRPWHQLLADALGMHIASAGMQANGGESLYEALKNDGYLAAVGGEPRDLSTNPKHMQGFGLDP